MFSAIFGVGTSEPETPSSSKRGELTDAAVDAEITSLKQEVEHLRKLLSRSEAKANAAIAAAAANDESDIGVLKFKASEAERKLELCQTELNDAVIKYRILIMDASKAAHVEVQTSDKIKETIQKQKDDFCCRECTDDVRDMKDEIERLKLLLSQKDNKIESLRRDCQLKHIRWTEDTEKLVNQLGDHKDSHNKVLDTVGTEIENLQKKNQEVADVQGDTAAKAKKADKEAQKAAAKLADVEKEKDALEQQAQNLQTALSDLNAINAKLGSTNSSLNQQITEVRNEQISLESKVETLQDQLAKAARDKDNAISDMEKKNDQLKEKIFDVEDELRRAQDDLLSTNNEVAKAKAALEALNRTLADQRELHDKALGAKDAAHNTANSASKQVADLLADSQRKDEAYRIERKALLEKIDALMMQAIDSQSQTSSFQSRIDSAVAQKSIEMNTLMTVHSAENEANNQQLRQLKAANDNLMSVNEELNRKIAQLSRQSDQDKSRIGDLEAQIKALSIKYGDMPAQLAALKSELTTLQRLYEDQLAQNNDLRNNLNEALQTTSNLQAKLSSLQSTSNASTASIRDEVKEVQTQNTVLRDKIGGLTNQISGLEADVKALERRSLELTANNAALKADNANLEKNLVAAQSEATQLRTIQTTEIITKTQRLPEGLQDKIDSLTTQLKQAQSLTFAIQQDMAPVEESSSSSMRTSSSSSSSNSSSTIKK